jgi:hypothetical protein
VTYTNTTTAQVSVGNLALAARPPGGTHGGGPYDDLLPWVNGHTFAANEAFTVTATRLFTSSDPVGSWDFYPTYQYPVGGNTWFDGPDQYVTVQAGSPQADPPRALQGVYPGFADQSGMSFLETTWEAWLGRPMKFIDTNLDVTNWSAAHSDIWAFWDPGSPGALWTRPDIASALTVMLASWPDQQQLGTRGALQNTANGANDATYQYLCSEAPNAGVGVDGGLLIARIGHEADCDCYPWEFQHGNADVYIQAFQHVAALLRGCFNQNGQTGVLISYNVTSEACTFDYLDAAGVDQGQLEIYAGYPGDAYVDIIGMDLYSRAAYPWSANLQQLNIMENFAVAHGKQVALPEWGLWTAPTGTGDDPTFVQNVHDWMASLPASGPGSLAFHCYFDQYAGVEINNFPNAKVTYYNLFGG